MEKNQTKKNKFKLPFVILVYVLLIPLYSNSQINYDKSFVTYFDAIKMAKEHIPDFELINERLHWIYGRVFTFKNVKSNELIFFSVGIYHSNEVADTVAQDYFKYMSAAMDYGSANKLGDKYWSLSSISGNYTNIFFIRKNAFFRISSHNYSELMPFALKVDSGIIEEKSYVKMGSIVEIPKIKNISKNKEIIVTNDNIKITVKADNENREALEYQFYPGLTKSLEDSSNVFKFKVLKSFINKNNVANIKAVVYNKGNVISSIEEFNMNVVSNKK